MTELTETLTSDHLTDHDRAHLFKPTCAPWTKWPMALTRRKLPV